MYLYTTTLPESLTDTVVDQVSEMSCDEGREPLEKEVPSESLFALTVIKYEGPERNNITILNYA